ncbi:glycine cleavage system protein GcvH [Cellulomonas timonensis]|uniref:glycine cleavage system protein GcvH n=1 Tax=Cellulomonas timonensis TaxID=1689271 RepID=UPI000833DCF6|nr:glycine cleavage system protein GcvH [Cellulomonas timonensis]
MSSIPENLKYTAEHEWVLEGDPSTVGVTATAADALGDVVYLELPAVGDVLSAGTVVGEIESTKSVSELYSPVSGTVIAVNDAAVADPSVVNSDPYGEGWLLKVEVTGAGPLLTAAEYQALTAP